MINTLLTNNFAKVNQTRLIDNFDVLEISHQHFQAKVSLYGGQVLSYQPIFTSINDSSKDVTDQKSNQHDVFWLSKKAYYQQGKAIRGGIPLCWPWFGANDKATDKVPSTNHGFAREVIWQVESIEADETKVTVVLVFHGKNQHVLWPNAFELKQTLVFGKTLKQSLTMTNLSQEDAQYSGALHNYFCVSNPENVTVDALTGYNFDDKLTAKTDCQQDYVSCVGPIDREYHIPNRHIQNKSIQSSAEQSSIEQSNTVIMLDNVWRRQIEVNSTGCSQWVLWNPGVELAASMADIHANGEQAFVCLEAANSKWQSLPANKTITISQEINVSLF